MPTRVGHIKKVYEDGHVRVVEEVGGQEYFGRLVIGSGGMLMFSPVDERRVTVGGEMAEDKAVTDELKTKVTVKQR